MGMLICISMILNRIGKYYVSIFNLVINNMKIV